MDLPLSERVALVTGASSGIGRATAIALAESGVRVAVTARRPDLLESLVAQIVSSGGVAIALPGDITDEKFARAAVYRTIESFGRLDILVNSAGTIQAGGVEDADAALWRQVMDVNFFATLYTCSAAIGPMRKQGGGDIINVSSTGGRRAASVFGPYGASKFALNGMTEGMRQEVGGYGIRVCVVEPGATSTGILEVVTDPEKREFMRKHIHNENAMMPRDVAAVILCTVSLPARANVSEILVRPTADTKPM